MKIRNVLLTAIMLTACPAFASITPPPQVPDAGATSLLVCAAVTALAMTAKALGKKKQ